MVSLPTPDDALASLPNNDRWQHQQHQHQQREVPPSSTMPQDDAPELTTQRDDDEEEEVQNNTNHLPATNRNVGIFVKSHGNEVFEIRRIDKKDNNKEEVNKEDDDDESTKSVFSLDSFHRIDVRWTTKTTTTKSSPHHHHHHRSARVSTHNDAPLFTSVVVIERGININDDDDDTTANNICPCQCIYFTMRETTCLIISAMGCGVFLAGIISLCFYLSGWWNEITD
jgi:hypothetical protein